MKHYTNTLNPVDFPSAEYEAVALEQAQPFWDERNRVLRARSEALVVALVGRDLAPQWWTSANLAFEGQTPCEQFDRNAERVYSYLMRSAEGAW
jgi:endo-1,4-beta-D-glucanase Y